MTTLRRHAILFDVEGVIAHPLREEADRHLGRLREGLDLTELDRARNIPSTYALWTRYSVGRLTPHDYWGPILAELGVEDAPENIAQLVRVQRDTWWGRLDETVLSIVRRLRGLEDGPTLAVLSNSAPEHEPAIGRFESLFDITRFSHRTGARKPDAAAFVGAAEAIGLPPERIIFIDDKSRNTNAAAALGMQGVVFHDAQQLEAELAELGALVDSETRS